VLCTEQIKRKKIEKKMKDDRMKNIEKEKSIDNRICTYKTEDGISIR
jgi:hypothetical protein